MGAHEPATSSAAVRWVVADKTSPCPDAEWNQTDARVARAPLRPMRPLFSPPGSAPPESVCKLTGLWNKTPYKGINNRLGAEELNTLVTGEGDESKITCWKSGTIKAIPVKHWDVGRIQIKIKSVPQVQLVLSFPFLFGTLQKILMS